MKPNRVSSAVGKARHTQHTIDIRRPICAASDHPSSGATHTCCSAEVGRNVTKVSPSWAKVDRRWPHCGHKWARVWRKYSRSWPQLAHFGRVWQMSVMLSSGSPAGAKLERGGGGGRHGSQNVFFASLRDASRFCCNLRRVGPQAPD